MDWKKLKKIDAHVHLLPPESLALKKGYDPDCWGRADMDEYLALMEEYNVQTALLVPINEGGTYYDDPDRTNAWLGEVTRKRPGRFMAFADVLNTGGYFHEMAPWWLEKAVKEYGLRGLKLHPTWGWTLIPWRWSPCCGRRRS